MSILGVALKMKPEHVHAVLQQLAGIPGVDVLRHSAAGSVAIVIEDSADALPEQRSAAATLGEMALWPQVLVASLVYEYSGPESPAPQGGLQSYRAWRSGLGDPAQAPHVPT